MKYILFISLNIHHFHQITTFFFFFEIKKKCTGWVNKFRVLCNVNIRYNIKTKTVNVHIGVTLRRLRAATVVVGKNSNYYVL